MTHLKIEEHIEFWNVSELINMMKEKRFWIEFEGAEKYGDLRIRYVEKEKLEEDLFLIDFEGGMSVWTLGEVSQFLYDNK